jgi:hypothetical protein
MSGYTFKDYEQYLDDQHAEERETKEEESRELKKYFDEQDPFYYSTIDDPRRNEEEALLEELDGWFEPDPADVDAAFERHLWLTGTE